MKIEIDKSELVILRPNVIGFSVKDRGTEFNVAKFYRHIKMANGYHLVFGETFNPQVFYELFESAHDKVMRDWTTLGLVKDGKIVSKKGFKERASLHAYGRGKNALHALYFYNNTGPKNGMYAFYPNQGTQSNSYKQCYMILEETINGEMLWLDENDIMFGNSGIPMVYGEIKTRLSNLSYYREPFAQLESVL